MSEQLAKLEEYERFFHDFYLRLSSATTELVIFAVVIFGLSPLVPDRPDVSTYTGIMMHLVMPFLALFSFIFNDAPIGRLKPIEIFQGTAYISHYAGIMLILYGFRILLSRLARIPSSISIRLLLGINSPVLPGSMPSVTQSPGFCPN